MARNPTCRNPLSETDIIDTLVARFPSNPDIERLGIGDDTAWLARPDCDLVTCDLMCEGTHFDRSLTSWFDIGWRCLAANLSDIAAMGGTPGPFTLGLGIDAEGLGRDAVAALGDGLRACVDAHLPHTQHCWLVGGDVVRSRGAVVLSITLLGRAPRPAPLQRRGARSGDLLVVFRPLGDSAAGLTALQAGLGNEAGLQPLVEAFARPTADLELGRRLAALGNTAALDLSDGLWRDAARFSDSSGRPLGAHIDVEALPTSPALERAADRLGLVPWKLAACGGEDYTLCAAIARERLDDLRAATTSSVYRPTPVGVLRADAGVRFSIDGRHVETPRGFEHFSEAHGTGDHEDDEHQP